MTNRGRFLAATILLLLALPGVPAGLASAPGVQATPAQKPGTQRPAARPAGLPPLIDRELFFGDPEIAGAQISPDGRYVAFLKPYKGARNIWVKAAGEPFETARPLTAETRRPIPAFFWTRDSRFILFVQDRDGDENFNVYAVAPDDRPAAGADVPAPRRLTEAKGVRAFIYAVGRKDPDLLFVGLNDRDPAWHDLYRIRISTGERTLLRRNTDRIVGWTFDLEDRLRLAERSAENGDTEILRVDEGGFTKVYTCSVFESCAPVRFHPDGRRVYLATNRDVELERLVLFDPATGREELVDADPEGRVDLGGALFSERTDALVGTVYVDDRPRYVWKDAAFRTDYEFLRRRLPGHDIAIGSSTADDRLWMVTARSDTEPGQVYLFDRASRRLAPQYRVRERLPREHLAPMTPIRYRSSDGLEIPAYLTLPKGVEPRGLPLVVVPHGGPWARDVWGYDPWAQFLANRGYAVLQPNFRGSTGYGKRFLDAGNDEWGGRMQDDITWGVRHLIERGIADPRRVGILGASYGGYATLAGLAFTPDVYAAGVSIVGPSNLLTLLESIPPYWEAARKLFHERMGDPTRPEERARLERQSPLNSADKIRAPLLVVQGANDPRVKKRESDQIVVALRDRGFPVEYLVAPDEGHGFARPVNNMAAFAAAERFLAKHLGGRFQESMPPEVAERLKAITVDPRTVTIERPVTPAAAPPRPVAPLVAGTSSFRARIEAGGQQFEAAITTEIRDDGETWSITETLQTPMGPATDSASLAKPTLVLVRRAISQGPLSIVYTVQGGKASGELKMGESARPIAVDLGGELFADGAGAGFAIATLPLDDGFSAAFWNLDVQSQKPKAVALRVAGRETVTVPAGTFETVKVELSSDDGSRVTYWIARDQRKPVKAVAVVPRMNGATITSELTR
ncbi:MAG TPA: alpha/beta fold hydrolase [Vicinamibacterales bacterium]|nr:alpha/beta fold hydrolase [Vicinamibacterales bacterium]